MIGSLTCNTKSLNLVRVAIGVALLFACSQLCIPLHPVPITMQTVGVMLLALLFDRRNALASILSYVSLGVAGFPMFSGYSAGPQVILGPRGGYIIGFIIAIYVMDKVKNRIGMHSLLAIFANCFIGTAVIYAFGVAWLALSTNLEAAIMVGFVPFIIPSIAKAAFLAWFLRSLGVLKTSSGK